MDIVHAGLFWTTVGDQRSLHFRSLQSKTEWVNVEEKFSWGTALNKEDKMAVSRNEGGRSKS